MRDRVEVSQGKFVLNCVDVVRSGRNHLVIRADCHSKYPELVYGGGTDERPAVIIIPGDHSLRLDDGTDQATMITLPRRCRDWEFAADAGRYTVTIAAWRRKRRWRTVWVSATMAYLRHSATHEPAPDGTRSQRRGLLATGSAYATN